MRAGSISLLVIGCGACGGPIPLPTKNTPTADTAVVTTPYSPPAPRCGDGIVEGDEACDEGEANDDAGACTEGCALAVCGDGLVWAEVEGCDDGNTHGADGCSPDCTLPRELDLLAVADATLTGELSEDRSGFSIAGAGDVNGDGFDDVVIGSYGHDSFSGAAHVVHGPFSGLQSLADAEAKLLGPGAPDRVGIGVAGAGDVDGDGYDDLLIGAEDDDRGGYNSGSVTLVYGPISGTVDLEAVGIELWGVPGDHVGQELSGIGDVDGDGFDDVVIGSPFGDVVYLLHGPVKGDLSLATADTQIAGSNAGTSTSGAGDIDGDGLDDLILGSYSIWSGPGSAQVFFGPVSGSLTLGDADLTLEGELDGDQAGESVAGAGDVDGDGLDDLIVGAPYGGTLGTEFTTFGTDSYLVQDGVVYLVYAQVYGAVSLQNADAKLVGTYPYQNAGEQVAAAGDVDGDGFDDLLVVGGWGYLLRGPIWGTHSLADADLRLSSGGDISGLVGVGDTDGDGLDDVMLSNHRASDAGWESGTSYLVLGTTL